MAIYGYARVSTGGKSIAGQELRLTSAGCVRVYADTVPDSKCTRPGLTALISVLRSGDLVTVTRLDRLGRSVYDLIQIVERIERAGANFLSIAEAIDTRAATGQGVFHIFASIAEFERQLIRERTLMGVAAAKAKGRLIGRPSLLTAAELEQAKKWQDEESMTQVEIAKALGVSESTWRRARAREREREVAQLFELKR